MSTWRQDMDRVDYVCDFREEAAKAEQKNGQTIVSHTSMAEVQAPDSIRRSIKWRCEDRSEYFDD